VTSTARALSALLVLGTVAAAFEPPELVALDAPARIQYRVLRDLDGDGIVDLMVLDDAEARVWSGRAGERAAAADATLALPAGTAMFDVVDVADEGQRLVARTAGGYFVVRPGGKPERLANASGPGLPDRPANLLWRSFRLPDGRTWIDVSLDGYRLDYAQGGTVLLPPLLVESARTGTREQSGRWLARAALARWAGGEFDGDGHPDLAVVAERELRVYPGDADGRVEAARSVVIPLADLEGADSTFADLDGDGRTDLLAVRRKEGRATLLIADPERGLGAPVRIVLQVAGEIYRAMLADLDGDGRLDLALPYLARPSMQEAVRVVLRGELVVKAPVFLNRAGEGGAVFRPRADTSLALPVRVRVRTDSAGRLLLSGLVVVEAGGDLDGDGRTDLLVTMESDALALHRGGGPDLYEKEPSATISIPDCSAYAAVETEAADLNGDGCSDIILHYRGAADRPDRLYLLLSRRD